MAAAQETASASTSKSKQQIPDEEFKLSMEDPFGDYQEIMDKYIQHEKITDDEVTKYNFERLATSARDIIWRLLFTDFEEGEKCANSEAQLKAAEMLEEYKNDACFYSPWEYNKWIPKLRDEVLKHGYLEFWRENIVKHQLGPCWSRDSDLFEGDEEPPLEFYAHAGCEAPFKDSLRVRAEYARNPPSEEGPEEGTEEFEADKVAALTGNFEAYISRARPLYEYRRLMKRYVIVDMVIPDEVSKNSIAKIAKAARDVVWDLLFSGVPTEVEFEKATELLLEFKSDACFYSPWEYNVWIVQLRDEVLKREYMDFWREKLVKLQLGPCWSGDSDLFDGDDIPPVAFYEKAGCTVPFDVPERRPRE